MLWGLDRVGRWIKFRQWERRIHWPGVPARALLCRGVLRRHIVLRNVSFPIWWGS
jgi:hypothetical protein